MRLSCPAASKTRPPRLPRDQATLSKAALGRTACGAALCAGGMMLSASPATAAGFWLYEMGTPDLGTASAGRAALAKDAATVFGNPAGMTSLDGSQLLVGTQLVYGDVHFDRGSNTTVGGGNGGNAAGLVPGGSLSFAQSVTPDFKLGFWSGSYFGGALDYDDGWSGRYYRPRSRSSRSAPASTPPTRSTTGSRSAAGRFVLYGNLEQEAAINNVLDGGQDGSLKFDDDTFGVGGMAGRDARAIKGTRFGVTYISPVELDFKDRLSTSNLGPDPAGAEERRRDPRWPHRSRPHGAAAGDAQRLSPDQRPAGGHGQPRLAELERFRQARRLGRQCQQRDGRPRL